MLERFRIAMTHVLASFVYGCAIAIAARPFDGWTLVGAVLALVAVTELSAMLVASDGPLGGGRSLSLAASGGTVICAISLAVMMAEPEVIEPTSALTLGMALPMLLARAWVATDDDKPRTPDRR